MDEISKKTRLEVLAAKWLEGSISQDEREEFNEWFHSNLETSVAIKETFASSREEHRLKILSRIHKEIRREHRPLIVRRLWLSAAAAVLLIMGGILCLHQMNLKKEQLLSERYLNAIKPGTNKAVLTLGDGRQVVLSQTGQQIFSQSGIKILTDKNGRLKYEIKPMGVIPSSSAFNTITTPKGGQFELVLPDGSRVWLNAMSSIRFPVNLAFAARRRVETSGEVYFEVSRKISTKHAATEGKEVPFHVISRGQSVEVLGTQFNINSYPEEEFVKTTLLEGKVSISASGQRVILIPGQQACVLPEKQSIGIREIDSEEVMAWKNGLFMFDGQDLQTILLQAARWYDVEIEFRDPDLKRQKFKGSISRFENIRQLLEVLESTGSVHFKAEGRRITAMK
ncbi:FecR family protein [Desertivirga xinjiangensis]|uniref:FecR family protein n=1 Tax=Desertivirga xinjiangensis TaxID=539206 RepID=UPI00210E9252|nr:FecR domain-containing protein [Pedobacter xinjiangensis]